MARLVLIISTFFLIELSYARLVFDNAHQKKESVYSLSQVCDFYEREDLPFIEPKGKMTVDCMGKVFSIIDFCLAKADGHFIRGLIKKEKVYCYSAETVVVKYQCQAKKNKCQNSLKSCLDLKYLLANQLNIYKHFVSKKGKEQFLNCYFISESNSEMKKDASL